MTDIYEGAAPGVHIEEVTPAGPIAGAGTSTAALIGTVADLGSQTLDVPVAVTSWSDYTRAFGGYDSTKILPYAVRGFFENGGSLAYVVPVKDDKKLDGAIDKLSRNAEISLVAAPGVTDAAAQKALIGHCEAMGDRFAILDGVPDATPLKGDGALQTQRKGLVSVRGYAALYWPWLVVANPAATKEPFTLPMPPSGHIAGVMARSDATRGVHKAPANEPVRGALDLGYALNDTEQGALNKANINAIRSFPGGGPATVWGARTLTSDTPWRFVNVRRLFSYVEDSILQGVRWAVFEPNNTALWKGLERTISEFLTRVWQSGALFGTTAAEAFYVKIDEELNPPATRALGRVVIEIGMNPAGTAEHVVVRIGIWAGGDGNQG
ncbi:phage tail sheath family protein [Actinoplanes sp. LDG1-06]|uniref:Phage tail sheath family protein n=1 Tax=Paractinoplanes ovalisporus TaxID=2810368 RepID=A0ABS2A2B1_9ACTN|nr:phage tail sheath subtilisin-like domain-containing protein [Actinoplanes ovalisporus]MBM2613993.1 phage tail sheath family protein [Actinoplanes ovalisporus]